MSDVDAMKRRFEREREARKQAEKIAEEKTRNLFEANEELREFTDHLEELVAGRTKELARARDEALAASRAKSEFLANMSHEIRTPLNAVIGLTELMLGTPLNEEQEDYCETINKSGTALLAIINDILDFSKIESGHMELESIPFDVRRCIEGSLDLLAGKAAERGIELAYMIDGQTPTQIVGDETRLRQILLNLINNAIKFTSVGEVIVEVNSRGLGLVDGRVKDYEITLAVRDTGIGIPKDRMDRLFKSFSQVDASTTRKFGGTGLGLAISRRLAEMMGGRMWVESEGEGMGSTFSFTMMTTAAESQRRVYLQGKQPSLGGKHVLVVDDNETNRQILRKQLEGWGMVVETAESGPLGLQLLEAKWPYDLAVVDMQMPEMDGVMLTREIRKTHSAESLPVMMLTSFGCRMEEKQTRLFAALLSKPVKMELLHKSLVTVLAEQMIRGNAKERVVAPTSAATLPQPNGALPKPNAPAASEAPPASNASPASDVPTAASVAPAVSEPTASAAGAATMPAASNVEQQPVATPAPKPAASPPESPLKILLTEDTLVNQKVALNILKRHGFAADVANNGVEAVDAVKRVKYDLVLMDVQMPVMDGVTATQTIREEVEAENQPWVIALTANALVGDRERFLQAGMDDYMSKPIDQGKLIEKLKARESLKMAVAGA